MVTKTDLEKRDRLAYLALYYAIQGDKERSEKIRRMIRQMSPEFHTEAAPARATLSA